MATLLAVGDVGTNRADATAIFRHCCSTLQSGDLAFAQLETTVSARGSRAPNARLAMRAPPAMARAVRAAGIGVASFAGNHCLDWGYEAFTDTLAHMRAAGVALCGAGETLAEARRPAILERGGLRLAFLAYSSILPEGYRAEADRAGCAPLRAHTLYEQIEHDQPGTPARILTRAHRGDLAALLEDIRAAREQAEVVIVSMHWGVHMIEAVIADYQREVAHAAIDAGAHAILGHHPHILKGVELHRGAPVFYSLGNFAIDQPQVWDPAITASASFRHLVSLNPRWRPDEIYMLPEDTRMTGVARLTCSARGVERVELLPAWIADDSAPQMLAPGDERFAAIAAYLERISRSQGLDTHIARSGDALLLTA